MIRWRKGCRVALLREVRGELQTLPPYEPGRGKGGNWPLPALSIANAPVRVSASALPGLVSVYEEYVDRFLVEHDTTCTPRHWLHAEVDAESGVLDHVFPLLEGPAASYAAEVLLVRLVWLIQQCEGLDPVTTNAEISVMTTVGRVGILNGRVMYRFSAEGIPISVSPARSLATGHVRVFNSALNAVYGKLSEGGRIKLAQLVTRIRPRALAKEFYADGVVTGGDLGGGAAINDKLLRIEQALMRSSSPADTLQTMLVPEYLSQGEFRTLLCVPWRRAERAGVTSDYLIRKMPLVRMILEGV